MALQLLIADDDPHDATLAAARIRRAGYILPAVGEVVQIGALGHAHDDGSNPASPLGSLTVRPPVVIRILAGFRTRCPAAGRFGA